MNPTPPTDAGNDGGAPKGEDGDWVAELGAPKVKEGPPDEPGGCGRPALPVAGDAGWLLNANGFDGAVAEVGVAPNENGLDAGWPKVDGLAGCEPMGFDGWPNPLGAPPPKLKEVVIGGAAWPNGAEEPNGAGETGDCTLSAGFEPNANGDGVAP